MNRILNPLVTLKSENDIERFLDTSDQLWQGDYNTSFFRKYKEYIPNIDEYYNALKVKTRVVCFLFDK